MCAVTIVSTVLKKSNNFEKRAYKWKKKKSGTASWKCIDPILATFGQICNFRDPNSVTFYFYELTHFLDWMESTLLFIYSSNILVRLLIGNMKNCLTPKNPKMCDPILVTLLKMRPHYSQSSRENATPSSGTSPVASYKEVPSSLLFFTLNARK